MALEFFCSICHLHHELPVLRSLPCGHTFCAPCIGRVIESGTGIDPETGRRRPLPLCPNCRAKFKASDPHPIYIDTSDPAASQAGPSTGASPRRPCHTDVVHRRIQLATQEVNRVGEDLRYQTVQKAVQEMEKVAELSDERRECLLTLVTAVAERWRGMLPMFSTIAAQRNEVIALKERLSTAEAQRDRAVAECKRANDIATRAVATTEQVNDALQQAKVENDVVKTRLEKLKEDHKEELEREQARMKGLYDSLNALKAKEVKQKAEIESLRAEARKHARQLREAAASQLISLEGDDDRPTENESQGLVVQPSRFQESLDEPAIWWLIGLTRSQAAYDLSGSQATVERLPMPGASRKRKGSEDDLVSLENERTRPTHRVPTPAARAAGNAVVSRLAPPQAPVFPSDWQLDRAQVKPADRQRPMKRSASAATLSPLALDHRGKPLKPVQVGTRKKFCRDS
ncbi:hypothetical protein OH77DRAFT_1254685 [Trametes cingulata]|nr:hypothetical protein OH77DRAFT_1254685 [Trametes cingulata]